MRAIVHLVVARLTGRRRAGTLMIPAAVAGAVAVLLGAGLVSLVAQDATLRRAIERAAPADRTVRVEVFKVGNTQLGRDGGSFAVTAEEERLVRGALPREAGRGPVGEGVVFSELNGPESVGRPLAVDELARRVRVRSGRLPRTCTATRCEVLVLGDAPLPRGAPLGNDELRIVPVGRGDLDPQVVGAVPPPPPRGTFMPPAFYLVTPSLEAIHGLAALDVAPRRYSFSRELDPAEVHPWTVDDLNRDLRRARGRLKATTLQVEVHAPDRLLGSERMRGVVAERRLLIIAGLAAAALLGFAVLAASMRRRDVAAEVGRLRDAGARPWQLRAFLTLEAGALALAGTLAGLAVVGAAAVGLGAAEAGDPALFVREVLLDAGTPVLAGASWLAATAILAGALRGGDEQAHGRRGATGELVTAGALALLVWQAGQRGALGPRELAAGGSAPPELLLLPGLLALVAALLTARATGPALQRVERLVRPAGVTVQLAVLSLVRQPGRTSAATGFLAAGVTLGLFALSHADALRTGARENAAFVAGADLRVSEAPEREGEPGHVFPLARYGHLDGVRAVPALRAKAEPLSAAGGVAKVTVLGLPGDEIDGLPAVRKAIGVPGRRLGGGGEPELDGAAFPAGTELLRVRARVTGVDAQLELVVQEAGGRITRLGFADAPGPRMATLETHAPRGGGRVVGVELTSIPGVFAQAPIAEVRFESVRAVRDGRERVLTRFEDGWTLTPGAQPGQGPGSMRFETAVTVGALGLVARQPEASRPIPAVVSRRLAAEADADGILPLRLATGEVFKVDVAGSAERLPTAGRDFVLVEARSAYRAINGGRAGALALNEMWLRVQRGRDAAARDALARAPFRSASVVSRAELTARLEADPVARTAIGALWAAAALALAIAACGLALTVRGALADGAQELVELEAMGATPRELRRQLRIGAAVVGAGGAAVGTGGAASLTALFTALVHVSADGRDPQPPLHGDLGWGIAVAALAAAALVAGLWVAAVTRRAFSADAAGRLGA